jgi:hypothetical protein
VGGFFKGSNNQSNTQPVSATLRVQTSILGRPVPIGAGQNRASYNMICWVGFTVLDAKTPGGKGGAVGAVFGKGDGAHDYNVTVMLSLGEGPMPENGVTAIYNGNSVDFLVYPPQAIIDELALLGFTVVIGNRYPATYIPGTYPGQIWSVLTDSFPAEALSYPGQDVIGFDNVALGQSPAFPNLSIEKIWAINTSAGSATFDVNPVDWITPFLTNADWGVQGFPPALLGDLSAYATYCQAYGLYMSPLLTDQVAAQSHLEDVMKATAADFKWSSGQLTIGIYADLPGSGNLAVFTPAIAPVYALTSADFQKNQGSLGQASSEDTTIVIARKNPSQAVNMLELEYLPRGYLYNPLPIFARDDAAIEGNSGWVVPSDLRSHHFWCLDAAAMQSAFLQLQRERILAQYQFTLGAMYALLEIFDAVSLTEPAQGLNGKLVRIVEIQENEDRSLTMTAEDVPQTIGPVAFTNQAPLGAAANYLEDPGPINPPVIFAPPATLASGEVWAAVSGENPALWGGCNVWISTDGGATYPAQVGTINAPARQGVLTAILPSVTANPSGLTVDNTNTLAVNLTESQAALASGTSADMLALTTLCYCDGELIAYENATLTTAYNYDLAPMVRGAYGSPIGSHAIGAQFARLDSSIFAYPYSAGQVGTTINIKFQGFNIYGQGLQDLADCTAYPFVIVGSKAPRTDTYNVNTTTSGPTTQVFTTPFLSGPGGSPTPFVSITWTPLTAGDVLNISSITLSQCVFEITNGGSPVVRAATVVVTGY